MPRPSKFTEHQILDSAARIIANSGIAAATMSAIAHALGAPSGSIYHRFQSRDELLGRLWLGKIAAFHRGFSAALQHDDPNEAAIAASLFVPQWVRSDRTGARIAIMHRREEFVGGGWPPDMEREARRLGKEFDVVLDDITRRLFGEVSPTLRRATRFAIIDIPYAGVRPHISRGEAPPPEIDNLVRAAAIASIRATRETYAELTGARRPTAP
ncbi:MULTISPECIES: TetR/AcrR family transcriptional regulator [Bradyrhizobium]|uniref:TetR/AcrR family transcriptional regulator n=1 Tax=Bradyrhizobium TaxID=374 RepID=UPI00155E7540|nr:MULTISPECIES: TetR/AcrR family transcriptional regulator [Bradyrhizobium]MDD1518837.1 TetR family transcriptional regulator [Bradyrhizobium sp. WBAH30]MDD1541165.1 TetR family transcriptional regulator [Bradyrhizobium sp. WBAH41]MDD1557211.1 TetR family transcriptional regulator [Bradyrhizobium sp. WBAH23]MDD1563800.1 TetR family transcriptional regulator [Bradyrhizobium sp. WBAH33]MDD1590031.1 TetR family transcriptional regulator [Bradyrhizobium sp. WBAH42]